ncbi:MAG: hypothetical protein JSW68_04850, partial [Burkholderiales bacterium]
MTDQLGMGAMLETMDMMRKAWTHLSLPSGLAPTIDLNELDKRIADLRTVEQWLNMNLAMLRSSVQALEMQRVALANMQAFGEAVAAGTAAAQGAAPGAAPSHEAPAPGAMHDRAEPGPSGEPGRDRDGAAPSGAAAPQPADAAPDRAENREPAARSGTTGTSRAARSGPGIGSEASA